MGVLRSRLAWLFALLFCAFAPAPALAFGDCPLVGTLENFEASREPQITNYNSMEMIVSDKNDSKRVVKNGKICEQQYDLTAGMSSLSALEIMRNYAEGLPGQGLKIVNAGRGEEDEIFAVGKLDGAEYWVRVYQANGNVIAVRTLQVASFHADLAPAGAKDCPLVPIQRSFQPTDDRYDRTYDRETFRVDDGTGVKNADKYGVVCKRQYDLKQGLPPLSALEIMRNYAEGLPAAGFTIVNKNRGEEDEVDATINKDGAEYWVRVWESNGNVLAILTLRVAPFHVDVAAAGPKDCPLVPIQRSFQPTDSRYDRTYERQTFRVDDGTGVKNDDKYGVVCQRQYDLKAGLSPLSAVEIMRNYAEALPAAEFTIVNKNRGEEDEVDATITKDGAEYWVRAWESNGNVLAVMSLRVAPFQSSLLPLSDHDCPIVPTLRDFQTGEKPKITNFESLDFRIVEGGEDKTVSKKGKVCRQQYELKSGVDAKSALEIMRNYAEGLPALGMQITNTKRGEDDDIYATMSKDGVETWAHVWESNGNVIAVNVLQIEPFHSTMKTPQAAKTPVAPAKARFNATAMRDGKPLSNAWCGAFKPGATGDPIVRGASGQWQEIAAGAYDIGCFVAECGATSAGWSRSQSLAAGDAQFDLDIPQPRVSLDLAPAAPAQTPETVAAESGDFPYLPPLPGSTPAGGKALSQPFYVQPADAKQPELVAERSIEKSYQAPQCAAPAAIGASYRDALEKSGWSIVNMVEAPEMRLTAHFGQNGRNIWALVHAGEAGYAIDVADMTASGARIAEDLGAKCHLALTGVLFDFAKSKLKPESDAVLVKVSEAMSVNPKLKLEIQGHTDNIGSDAYNQKLSDARAKSVVKWLEEHDVVKGRLTAHGYGKSRPIADNDSDEGRAKNRRVELQNAACKSTE